MDIIFSLVLIALGGLAAKEIKPLGKVFGRLEPYAPALGVAGLIFGFIWLAVTLTYLRHFNYYPLQTLIFWGYSLLLMALGLIFGHDIMSKIIGTPSPAFVIKAGEWRACMLPYRTQLGLAGVVLGVLLILYHL